MKPWILIGISIVALCGYLSYAGYKGLKYYVADDDERKEYSYPKLYLVVRIIIIGLLFGLLIWTNNYQGYYQRQKVLEKRTELVKAAKPMQEKVTVNNNQLRWYKTERKVYTIKGDIAKLKQINQKIQTLTAENNHYNNQLNQLNDKYTFYVWDHDNYHGYIDDDLSDFY